MLKISILDLANQRRLLLEGRLVAPWTTALRGACEDAKVGLGDRELVIDLKCVTAISPDGENILLQLLAQGVRLHSSGVFTKLFLKQLGRKTSDQSTEKKQ